MWWCFIVSKHCTSCLGESSCCLLCSACEVLVLLSLFLLFIEPIQGTQAQFSSVERHVRISTYGSFSRMPEWFKCCWLPFDFGLLLVKPARMLPANLGLHLTALNTLTFCIKFFQLVRWREHDTVRVHGQDAGLRYMNCHLWCLPLPQESNQTYYFFPVLWYIAC